MEYDWVCIPRAIARRPLYINKTPLLYGTVFCINIGVRLWLTPNIVMTVAQKIDNAQLVLIKSVSIIDTPITTPAGRIFKAAGRHVFT